MHRSPLRLILGIVFALPACGGSDNNNNNTTTQPAAIQITGEFFILTHATTQLTAATQNATDSGYTWTSSDEGVATVSDAGLVTGVAPGKVTITAAGNDSKASSSYNMVVSEDVPYLAAWLTSGHADTTAEPFNHWNEDDPPEVPTTCAKCHSTPGFRDYIGADGSAAGTVDAAAPIGTVIECKACHNQAAQQLASVTFPSGVTIDGLGPEARCMTCHQGREATDTVDKSIADAVAADPALVDDDTVSAKLSFRNIHYFFAGATLEAGRVRGGYEYAGKSYDTRFRHVPGVNTCLGCHDQHTLAVKIDTCKGCHTGVTTVADLRNIRMMSSMATDYDGDGNTTEGIAAEIDGVRAKLMSQMQAYTAAQGLDKLCYNGDAYPYFFKDTDGDGACSEAESTSANGFKSWTKRLVRASYNYQVSVKDPGAFAHNAKYILELLYDSIDDLNGGIVDNKFDMATVKRTDPGHFDGSAEPARHWDGDAEGVSADCSRCHSGSEGLRFYLTYGTTKDVPEPDNGFDCATCHESFGTQPADFKIINVTQVTFPSGVTVKPDATTSAVSFLCMTCHQGRESKATIDKYIATTAPDKLSFRNVHYLAAGATLYGGEAKVGYEYDGKTYAGRWQHPGGNDCTSCHNPKLTEHTFQPNDNLATCKMCHGAITDVEQIRLSHRDDYDGDGNTTEPLTDEIAGLRDALLAQMQVGNKICYSGDHYPYWFKDTNGDGTCDATEATSSNGFSPWTPGLLKAAHNYQISVKEPGAWAHNFAYMAELLIDSIENLGGDVSHFKRP